MLPIREISLLPAIRYLCLQERNAEEIEYLCITAIRYLCLQERNAEEIEYLCIAFLR